MKKPREGTQPLQERVPERSAGLGRIGNTVFSDDPTRLIEEPGSTRLSSKCRTRNSVSPTKSWSSPRPGSSIFMTLPRNDAVAILDLKGNIRAWNRRAEEMYGYSAAEALTMSVFDLIPVNRRQETRNLSHDLAPPSLQYVGLIPAIRKLIAAAQHPKNLQIRLFHRNVSQARFRAKDIIIYRIIQEALQNIVKHAKAFRARVKIILQKSMLFLEVSDNGRGFSPDRKLKSGGLGLALMREHVSLIHGTLSIESQTGKGTSIKIQMPVKAIAKSVKMERKQS